MRLLRPKNLKPGPSETKNTDLGKTVSGTVSTGRKTSLIKAGIGILIVVIIAGAATAAIMLNNKDTQDDGSAGTTEARPGEASLTSINEYQNSQNVEEMRALISAYIDTKDYPAAIDKAKELSNKSQTVVDYSTLLWLCVTYSSQRETCIEEPTNWLKSKMQTIAFLDAYTIGDLLNDAGHGAAVDFYQRAYDTYDESQVDTEASSTEGGTKTKEQLKGLIDELRR